MDEKQRISQRIRRIAKRYEAKGYDVEVDPPIYILPVFLMGHKPTMIAKGNGENVVILVKSTKTIRKEKELYSLAKLCDASGWRLELNVSNPRKKNG